MDAAEALITLLAAALGAASGLWTSTWSFRRATDEARTERLSGEKATLQALLLEMTIVRELIDEESPSSLPTEVLVLALAGIHHMTPDQQRPLVDYAQSVRRYNGRVVRLVAYGAGKRAHGEQPGAEAPTKHARIVRSAVPPALKAVETHLTSDRFVTEHKRGRGQANRTPRKLRGKAGHENFEHRE